MTLVHKQDGLDQVRVAGSFVAARSGEKAAVYDLRSGRVVYQASLPSYFSWIDLQADGTMVAVWLLRERTRGAWFSPDEPWRHSLAIRPVLIHPHEQRLPRIAVRLVKDRLAYESQISPGKSELVVTDLKGKVMQHVASFDEKRLRVRDFDFDGKRLTWATKEVHNVTKDCNSTNGHMTCSKRYSGPTTIYVARLE